MTDQLLIPRDVPTDTPIEREPAQPALGEQPPSRVVSVMGPANRAPGAGIMGGSDHGLQFDVMGGTDRLPFDVMGGPDRGLRVDVMGQSDPKLVDLLFNGGTDTRNRQYATRERAQAGADREHPAHERIPTPAFSPEQS